MNATAPAASATPATVSPPVLPGPRTLRIYQPLEKRIREVASRILEARTTPDLIPELKEQLAAVLDELKQKAEPGNGKLIQEMTSKLKTATLHN